VGIDPETQKMITASIGRFGPYLKLAQIFKSIPKDEDVLTIGLNRAVDLLAEAKEKAAGGRVLGEVGGTEVHLSKGRFGFYVKHKGVMANLPKSSNAETLTLEEALALIEAKKGKGGKGAKGKGKAKAEKTEAAEKPAKAKAPAKTTKTTKAKKPAKMTAESKAPKKRKAAG
jgi:DNA topoisomerase-1